MEIQLQLLGVPRVAVDGRTIAVSWPRRSLSLLTYLVTARGWVTRDAAAFALWPDDDEDDARGNLRRNLNVLRAALPPPAAGWIVADAGSVGFDRAAARTDVAVFEALAADPAAHASAVAVYGGDYAASLYDPWVLAERERLRARYHAMLGDLISTAFSSRRFDDALDYARRIIADEPFREDVVRRVVGIRYAMGDRPGALAEFERFRRALRSEMDIEPMPETLALHDLVLRGEPLPHAPDAGTCAARGNPASGAALLPFAGRADELAQLQSAWDTASASTGTLLFVAGEAGIGKTRLIAQTLDRIVGTSARVLRGTTGSPEARPFEAILSALAQTAPYLASIAIEPVWLAALAPLVPQIQTRIPDAAVAPLPPERETLRLFEACAKLLAATARARPVVLILEDVHWAGQGTLAALRHLASRLRGHRVLLLVTYRDGDGRAVESVRRELCRSGHARLIRLTRLTQSEATEALTHSSSPPSEGDAPLLAARSEGHPLFLTELLREYPAGGADTTGGIAELVKSRLTHATAGARALAGVAAICGSTFDLDLVRAVTGWSDGAAIDAVGELLERQFIRATAEHEGGSYAFTHALVRGAVAAAVPAGDARRTHYIVARALEARDDDAHAVEIALHWAAAGDTERAARAYAGAARASLRSHARDEAAALATAGLALTTDTVTHFALLQLRIEANLGRVQTDELRADAVVLSAIAEALDDDRRYAAAALTCRIDDMSGEMGSRAQSLGRLRRFDGARASPRRSAEIAKLETAAASLAGDRDAALAAAARYRDACRRSGDIADELQAEIRIGLTYAHFLEWNQALAILAPLECRVTALAELAVTAAYWQARASAAHGAQDSSAVLHAVGRWEEVARSLGDRLLEGHAAWMAGCAHSLGMQMTQALRETDRASAIYASIGATGHQERIKSNRGAFLLQTGRITDAIELLREALQTARRTGTPEAVYFCLSNLGVAHLAAGDAKAAIATQREALVLARQLASTAFEALVVGDLGAALAADGQVTEGVALLIEAAEMNATLQRSTVRAHDLARAARWERDPSTAAAFARQALAVVEATGPDRVKHAPEILWLCSLAFERSGDTAAAAYTLDRARTVLDRLVAAIEDEDDRRSYCALAWSRALLAEPATAQ